MWNLSHHSWLHIFIHCFLVLRSGSDSLVPAKGEEMFSIWCGHLLMLIEMSWISLIANGCWHLKAHQWFNYSLIIAICVRKYEHRRRLHILRAETRI